MENRISSAMPINYQVIGLPIPSGTSQAISVSFVPTPLLVLSLEGTDSTVFNLQVQEKSVEQLWHWTEPAHVEDQSLGVSYLQEKSWQEAVEDVLANRAATWKELAGL